MVATQLCTHCGEEHDLMELYRTRSGAVCWSCFDNYYSKCGHCRQSVSNSELYAIQNGWGGEVYHCNECIELKGAIV